MHHVPGTRRQEEPLAALSDVLNLLTIDDLKERLPLLLTRERLTWKAECVALIEGLSKGRRYKRSGNSSTSCSNTR